MKSLKSVRKQYGSSDRNKGGKFSDKYSKLDRKSSRGMIYENEELRLRTININAEVERGQTDIKRLRKENDHLRREIWTLRDECDRLNKRVKAKFIEHEQGVYSVRCSGGGNGCTCQCTEGGAGCEGMRSRCNSEDSDSCDSCCCHDANMTSCNEECCNVNKNFTNITDAEQSSAVDCAGDSAVAATKECPSTANSKLTSFDHLSVVSEETLSNSEVLAGQQSENILNYTPDICGSQTTLPSLVRPLTPLTPIDLVANELNDLQSITPPLSYFENILQQHMTSNYRNTPENSPPGNSSTPLGKHTNGWDYKLESPFVQSQQQDTTKSPVLTKRLPAQTLTTFVPRTTTTSDPSSMDIANSDNKPALPKKPTELSANSQQQPAIETVTITTLPPNGCGSQSNAEKSFKKTPKHFFAPIKPKLKLNTAIANQKRLPPPPLPPVIEPNVAKVPQHKCEPPDIYVTNALATPYRPPTKPTVQPPPIPQRMSSTSITQAQADSANLESILNDIEAISEDILNIQLVKNTSRDNFVNKSTDSIDDKSEQSPLKQDNKNTKPYRSEMNLLLSYQGDNTTIKRNETTTNTQNSVMPESAINTNIARRTKSLERDHTDSPSPHVPDPMQPFPEHHRYIGFDRINRAAIMATTTAPLVAATATQTVPVLNSPQNQRAHLPLSPLVTGINTPKFANGKQMPPTPPIRSYAAPLNIKCAGAVRSSSVTGCLPKEDSSKNSPLTSGVAPNKSQLYAALASAASKRAQFRSQPTNMTRSLDMEGNTPDSVIGDDKNGLLNDKEELEKSNRKDRRVSIVCADTDSPESGDNPSTGLKLQVGYPLPSTSGSCTDLHASIGNPVLQSLKQSSQSTPNSPHSARKHENSPVATTPVPPIISITPNSTPQHKCNSLNVSGMLQLVSRNHAHSSSYPSVISPLTQQQKVRKTSQDAIKASAAEMACAAANVVRSKCSRRHSDSTVSHNNQRISGVSGGTNGTHHHHPHLHHHRQHSSSVVSNTNPHQTHHSRRDSNQETVASYSDRNSNSLASSRESSASFSMRSQRRKLSISSHTGGKIPWCGCWGNGCL